MAAPTSTDVSTAQSFDVGSFLNNLVSTAGAVITGRTSPTQNTGQPAATTTPNLRANPTANTQPGPANNAVSPSYMWLGLGAAVILGAVLLARSRK